MSVTLPEVISRYFDAAAAKDTEAVIACFAADGSVTDEGRMMTGHQAIRGWREGPTAKLVSTTTVLGTGPTGRSTDRADTEVILTRVEGDFPGSPVDLTFRFVVRDGLIAKLEIAP